MSRVAQKKQRRQARPVKRKSVGRKSGPRKGNPLTVYARMIADPCNSAIAPGLYGTHEGLTARVRNTIQANLASGLTAGYVIWFPDYTGDVTDVGSYNIGDGSLFVWAGATGSTSPAPNADSTPIGGEDEWETKLLSSKTLQAVDDPAAKFLASDLPQDSRTLSACAQLTYTGRMDQSSGELAYITNFPLSALNLGSGSSSAPSVDEMFAYCPNSKRFGTASHDVLFRPDTNSATFKPASTGVIHVNSPGGAGSLSTYVSGAATLQPTAIGFAWRGLQVASGTTSPITLTFTKSLEWRPKPFVGLTHTAPVMYSATSNAPKVLVALDSQRPSWQTKVLSTIQGFAGNLADTAFTGVMNNPQLMADGMRMFARSQQAGRMLALM
jgi:hypothetical protein